MRSAGSATGRLAAPQAADPSRPWRLTRPRSSTGYAAPAIYVAGLRCDESIPQRGVAPVADTTVVTVRNHYREHLEAIGAEPPE